MNAENRKKIKKWIETIDQIREDIETMQYEEEGKHDNLPEGLQDSERGEQMQEAIENLGSAADSLRDAIDYLDDAAK